MHVHQFWWACPLWFRRYHYSQKRPNFPFRPWTIYSPWSSKILIDWNQPKKFMQVRLMSYACAPILVGVTSPVSEILLLSKTAKFPFPTMDYSLWSSKNLINRNQPKKFMQVRIDELCMCTNFGGHDFSGFGDIATFKNGQISFSDHGTTPTKRCL